MERVLILCSGWILDGIQFIYDNDTADAHFHGGRNGEERHYKLADDEYLVSIKGKIAKCTFSDIRIVSNVEISTNKDSVYSGGASLGCSDFKEFAYTAGIGEQIFSLSGCYKTYISELNVAMKNL